MRLKAPKSGRVFLMIKLQNLTSAYTLAFPRSAVLIAVKSARTPVSSPSPFLSSRLQRHAATVVAGHVQCHGYLLRLYFNLKRISVAPEWRLRGADQQEYGLYDIPTVLQTSPLLNPNDIVIAFQRSFKNPSKKLKNSTAFSNKAVLNFSTVCIYDES